MENILTVVSRLWAGYNVWYGGKSLKTKASKGVKVKSPKPRGHLHLYLPREALIISRLPCCGPSGVPAKII